MIWYAVLVLAAGTYLLRVSGLLLADRLELPAEVRRYLDFAAIALLMALVVTASLTNGNSFAGWERPAGVATGGVAAWYRLPFVLVVVLAASTTALLRAL